MPKFPRNLLPPSKGWQRKPLVKPCFSFLCIDFLLIFPHGFYPEDVGSTSIRTVGKFIKDYALTRIMRQCSSYLSVWTFRPLKVRPPRCLGTSGTNRTVIKRHILEARRRQNPRYGITVSVLKNTDTGIKYQQSH